MPYTPAHDEMNDPAELAAFIERHPLASLVTHNGASPEADLIPLLLTPEGDLIGHVARNNPLWKPGNHTGETLAIFGPVHHYVSPNWYPSKHEHHEAVPTWNYLVAHAWGELVIHDEVKWVRAVVARLTNVMEQRTQPEPWRIGMAPKDYVDGMLTQIVGIELRVRRLTGRFKASGNRTDADRHGAYDGIAAAGGPQELLDYMARPDSDSGA